MADPWLAVAVCTNRDAEAARPTLTALAAQVRATPGTRGLVVTSGLGEAPPAEHRELASELGLECLAEPEPGLSRARNLALAAIAGEKVIAYLDDDAIPEANWLERLATHWRDAADDVACIGGAVLPRFASDPPAWMGPRLYPVLSLLDKGEGTLGVEPGQVWGANISFRATPLRDAGGFDPGLGAFGDLPLFGEESRVQRRLAEQGLRTLYAGDVRVEHVIGRERLRLREIARRRFLYGVVIAGEDERSGLGAAGRAVKAAAGLAGAAATGRRRLVGERTVRLAENAGIAVSPLARAWLRRRHRWPGAR
jgi:hypothetical protein